MSSLEAQPVVIGMMPMACDLALAGNKPKASSVVSTFFNQAVPFHMLRGSFVR